MPILNQYGIEELKDRFILIGLVQNQKTVEEFIADFKKYDTEQDWTYKFSDEDLKDVAEDLISFSRDMMEQLLRYGFRIYDTSVDREAVFERILEDIQRE